MKPDTRSTFASILAPCTPSVLTVLVLVISTWSWPFYYELPTLLTVSLTVSYVAFFLLGLPFIGFLRKRSYLNTTTLLLAGLVTGAIFGMLTLVALGLALGSLRYTPVFDWANVAAWGAGYGVATAVVYGLIAGWPNKSFKPNPLRGSA